MKRLLLIGNFGYKTNKLDGQTIKTRNVYKLIKQKALHSVDFFDTSDSNFVKLLKLICNILRSHYIILVPASRSLELFLPIVFILTKLIRIDFIVLCVGGWQVEFFEGIGYKRHMLHLRMCKKIKAFLPEVECVTKELKSKYGFRNCETFTNFRISQNFIKDTNKTEYLKLVFMARINRLKGYEMIFKFAELIADRNLKIKIDFWGPINENDKVDFENRIFKNRSIVQYKGVLQPEDINITLSRYDILLFPTQYYTEGIPGTIIDAYMAGLPVIATDWKYAKEVIKDGVCGKIVPFENSQECFNNAILELYENRDLLNNLKKNTKIGLEPFSEKNAWSILRKYIE